MVPLFSREKRGERASRRSEVARWATECKRKAYLLHCIYKKCKPCGIRKAIIQQGKQRSEFLQIKLNQERNN